MSINFDMENFLCSFLFTFRSVGVENCVEKGVEKGVGNYVDAYFNKGISYCNLALIAQENANKDKNGAVSLEDYKKIQDFYSKAKPCMEMVRKLQPENKERWAHALYRIYLYLNMGKEFDEIDKLLKN